MHRLSIGASSQKVYATSWHLCPIYSFSTRLLNTNYVCGPVLGTQSFDLWCLYMAVYMAGTHNTTPGKPSSQHHRFLGY